MGYMVSVDGEMGKKQGEGRDVIEICKKMKGMENLNRSLLFTDSFKPRPRGHR